jgi:hypothetical protein
VVEIIKRLKSKLLGKGQVESPSIDKNSLLEIESLLSYMVRHLEHIDGFMHEYRKTAKRAEEKAVNCLGICGKTTQIADDLRVAMIATRTELSRVQESLVMNDRIIFSKGWLGIKYSMVEV